MTTRSRHPAPEAWMQWLDGSLEPREAARLEAHRDACARCLAESEFLARVQTARGVAQWGTPGAPARRRARRLPGDQAVPGPIANPVRIPVTPPDVRGAGTASLDDARMVTRVFSWGEVGVLVSLPQGDDPWRIDGRVWLRSPHGKRVRLVLVHDDHVLGSTEADDGEPFCFQEMLPAGWSLEVHVPGQRPVVMEDPRP